MTYHRKYPSRIRLTIPWCRRAISSLVLSPGFNPLPRGEGTVAVEESCPDTDLMNLAGCMLTPQPLPVLYRPSNNNLTGSRKGFFQTGSDNTAMVVGVMSVSRELIALPFWTQVLLVTALIVALLYAVSLLLFHNQ